jgi:hypothetical protein
VVVVDLAPPHAILRLVQRLDDAVLEATLVDVSEESDHGGWDEPQEPAPPSAAGAPARPPAPPRPRAWLTPAPPSDPPTRPRPRDADVADEDRARPSTG